ncbi:MAG: IPT/TIG domain-containing protein, partial [Candidatus Hydrogenedentes bacterium]|nr:IPT/TIG domain-containing protein [Candidatus Hydrogenedentota bacterium]
AGNEAAFRAVPAADVKQADFYSVSPFDGSNPNEMYVSANENTLGQLDVTVVENGTGIASTVASAVEVLETFSVTPSVTNCAQASITLSQTASGFSLGSNNYLDGETVTADIVNPCGAPDKEFLGWSVNGGALQGVGQTTGFTFSVDQNTTLEAVFGDIGQVTIDTAVVGSATATVTLNPASPVFIGTNVEATYANAEPGNTFIEWRFNGVGIGNTNPINFNAAQNGTLTAVFTGAGFTVTTAVQGSATATVTLNPPQPALGYPGGTVVTATTSGEAAGECFQNWTQDGVDTGDTDTSYQFTVNANTTVTAVYAPCVAAPTITNITPNNAWIFGGVVARIDGTNLGNLTSVTVGGVEVFPWDVTATSIEIAIPENTSSTADTFQVGVVVTNASGSASTTFTYKNVETVDGVTTDAFILGAAPINPAAFAFRVGPVATGTVDIPQLNTVADRVFGLTQVTSTNGADLGTDVIPSGDAINGVLDFAIHLYQEVAVRQNTPVAPAALFSDISSDLVDFNTPIDPTTGQQVASTPLLLSFPLDGTALTNALVEEGVTVWGIATEYDYVADTTDVVLGAGGDIDFNTKQLTPIVKYQSTILNDEVDPDASTGADGAEPDMVMEARLYSLNAFSLRQNAVLPEAVTDGVRLQDTTGTIVFDNLTGGADFTVVSPRGGLAWIDKVEYVLTGTNTVVATQQLDRVPASNRGTAEVPDEFALDLTAPSVTQAGIVDIRIYLEEDAQPAITLERVLEYQAEVQPPTPNFLLLILGLLVAILGLAAGGNSGGGGGGPCFIATAAYGTPMATDIDALRAFRDTVLLDNAMGTAMVDAYYRVSPEIANVVAQSPVLAAAVRMVLVPVIFLSKMALALPGVSMVFTLAMMSVWYLRRRLRRQA